MPRPGATIYDLLLSCPGDVVDLKDIVKECVDDFNRLFGSTNNIKIELKHWNSDAYPQSGGSAQELLNQQFIHDCDACVALFANRFGSPTEKYDSGTEEEIEDMINNGKQVFMYFIERPVDPSTIDTKQLDKVRLFKEKYENKGIYWQVKNNEEFRKLFLNHLTLYFLKLISAQQEVKVNIRTPQLNLLMNDKSKNAVAKHSDFQSAKLFSNKEQEILELINQIKDIRIEKIDTVVENKDNSINDTTALNSTITEQLSTSLSSLKGMQNFMKSTFVKVVIDEEIRDTVEKYCIERNIIINEEFWDLGNLEKETRIIVVPYGSEEKYRGGEEAEKKYNLITSLWVKIYEYNEYHNFFKSIDELWRLDFIVSNTGSMFDEDIDVKIIIPRGAIVSVDDLPIPGLSCIEEINDHNLCELLFCSRKSDDIDRYTDYPINNYIPYDTLMKTPFNRTSASEEYEVQKKKYIRELESLFCYEVFNKADHDIIKFNIRYLKQNTNMYLPTHLFFKKLPEYIEYEIKSKHVPDVVEGRYEIRE